jgi:hypothetical protein
MDEKPNLKVIDTTAGKINAKLVVYRDYIGSNGKWRLFWEDLNNPGCGFGDESTVTGQPYFNTRKEAIARGIAKHGITAEHASF